MRLVGLIDPCRAVELCLKDCSAISHDDAVILFHRVIQAYTNWYRTAGVLTLETVQDELHTQVSQHLEEIRICHQGENFRRSVRQLRLSR